MAGLILIVWGVFMFNASTPYPGRYAVMPVLGTTLIILFCGPQGLVGKILSIKIMVSVGLISYSAYLWHQPIFAFSRQLNFGHLSISQALIGVVGTLLLAALTWRFVEQPFRKPDTIANVHIWAVALFGSLGLASFGVAGHLTNGFPGRALLPETIINTFQRSHRADSCFDIAPSTVGEDWLCDLGRGHGNAKFLVFGDSHALSLFNLFDAIGHENTVRGQFVGASGCPPLTGQFALKSAERNRSCFELNQRVFEHVASNGIDVVILVARWRNYTDKGIGVFSADHELSEVSRTAFRESVQATLDKYRAIGVDVYVVEQPPEQTWAPQLIYLRAKKHGGIDAEVIQSRSVSLTDHLATQVSANQVFVDLLESGKWITTTSAFCSREVCPVGDTEGSFYLDSNHLSDYGTSRLESEIRTVMDW